MLRSGLWSCWYPEDWEKDVFSIRAPLVVHLRVGDE
jgi:hypothetical protein